MAFKKISTLLIPGGVERTITFRAPRTLLSFLILLLLFCLSLFPLVVRDYKTGKSGMPRLMPEKIENLNQQKRSKPIAERLVQMAQRLDDIQGFKSEIRFMANEETGYKKTLFQQEVGTNIEGVHSFQTPSKPSQEQEMAARTHDTLDYLQHDIIPPKLGGEEALQYNEMNVHSTDKDDPDKRPAKKVSKKAIKVKIKEIAAELCLDPSLAVSMAKIESGYNPELVSPKGAVGVFQIMPTTARHHFGITRETLFDPETNIRIGISWMKSLLEKFDYDLDLSLAAYNAGVSRVVKAGYKIPAIAETRAYVRKVKRAMIEGG